MEKERNNPLNKFLEETEAKQEKILEGFLKSFYENHLSAINFFLKEKNKSFGTKIIFKKKSPKETPPKHYDEVKNKYYNLVTKDFIPFYKGDKPTVAKNNAFLKASNDKL